MIIGKNTNLRTFCTDSDILEYLLLYNNLKERTLTDHTEIFSVNNLLNAFKETGLWSPTKGVLLITTKADDIIGSISFTKTTDFELEIGYRLFKNENRNKGYMSESLQLFSSYLFNCIPHITRLKIQTAEDNIGSRKLAEKCGFHQEGLLRNAYYYRGKICNLVVYSLLREEALIFEENI